MTRVILSDFLMNFEIREVLRMIYIFIRLDILRPNNIRHHMEKQHRNQFNLPQVLKVDKVTLKITMILKQSNEWLISKLPSIFNILKLLMYIKAGGLFSAFRYRYS